MNCGSPVTHAPHSFSDYGTPAQCDGKPYETSTAEPMTYRSDETQQAWDNATSVRDELRLIGQAHAEALAEDAERAGSKFAIELRPSTPLTSGGAR